MRISFLLLVTRSAMLWVTIAFFTSAFGIPAQLYACGGHDNRRHGRLTSALSFLLRFERCRTGLFVLYLDFSSCRWRPLVHCDPGTSILGIFLFRALDGRCPCPWTLSGRSFHRLTFPVAHYSAPHFSPECQTGEAAQTSLR